MSALQIPRWLEDFLVLDTDGYYSVSIPSGTLHDALITELSSQLEHFSSPFCFLDLIDFSNIGAEGNKKLVLYMGMLSSLTSLDLDGNDIGVEGMKELAPHLGKLSSLTQLHLESTDIAEKGMRELAPHLGKLSALTELKLDWNDLGE